MAVSEQNISDEKLVSATRRTRAAWHGLLDAADASAWNHTQIATWLRDTHGVDGWWAQGLTVAYEQARGTRMPGQQPDGTFSTSSSKSLPGPQQEVLALVVDAYTAVSGKAPTSVRPEAKHPTARWKLDDGTSVLATVSPGSAANSRLALTHSRLGSEQVAAAKTALADILRELASRVDRSVD
jgi:hypothetical protein